METKLLGICTVNDEDAFNKMHSGALADRYQHAIYFRRPSRDLLWKILEREVMKFDGDLAWIDPCLDYMEEMGETSPRKAIALCISGAEQWITGDYAKTLKQTAKVPPVSYEDVPFKDLNFDRLVS